MPSIGFPFLGCNVVSVNQPNDSIILGTLISFSTFFFDIFNDFSHMQNIIISVFLSLNDPRSDHLLNFYN